METELRRHIKWAEAAAGPELFPYKDSVGILTIGYGRNLQDRGITVDEADFLLSTDIRVTLREAEGLPYWADLNSARKIVIADMLYNLGLTKFLRFKRFQAALVDKDYQRSAYEMKDSRWYKQTLRRAKVLHEAMLTGIWR